MKLGWALDDRRESLWRGDPAVDWDGSPQEAKDAYEATGDASGLVIREGQVPRKIRFRALTSDEGASIMASIVRRYPARPGETPEALSKRREAEGAWDGARLALLYFRVGAEVDGIEKRPIEGVAMLPDRIEPTAMWMHFGRLIFEASSLTDAEKKTSSPEPSAPATPPPSSNA